MATRRSSELDMILKTREFLVLLWRQRAWPLCAGALLLTIVSFVASDDLLVRGTGHLFVGWWLALLLVLPFPLAAVFGAVSFGVGWLLEQISTTKAELTQLPLMAFDLQVVAVYTDAFVEAMALPRWQQLGLYAGFLLAFVSILLAGVWQMRRVQRRLRHSPGDVVRSVAVATAAMLFIATQLAVFMARLPDIVDRSGYVSNIWATEVVVAIERRLGTVAFLYYSHALERRSRGNLVFGGSEGMPPDDERIAAAASTMLRLSRVPNDSLPNIVLLKVESTFDINEAFHLTTPVESVIYDRENAMAYGPLRVNTVGGGSWVSEFEVVSGVDSRLFGFSGFYTHTALSPWMSGSLATWLGERGYHTAAFYPVEGSFHNVQRAFPRYGFQQFLNSDDLGIEAWAAPDSTIAAAYLHYLRDEAEPFFAFFVLNENHGPHRCHHFQRPEELFVRLSGGATFEVDCGLNEFILRLRSSEHAMRAVVERLQQIEQRSGRPWLLVSFGDHQPHSFTGSGGYANDYSSFRRSNDLRQTMYRFAGTASQRFTRPPGHLPVTVLPTLISAFVAPEARDLYLGANLVLLQSCGVDAVGDTWSFSTAGAVSDTTTAGGRTASGRTAGCAEALAAAVASYRRARIFRLVDER